MGGVRSSLSAVRLQDPVGSFPSDSHALADVFASLAAQKERDYAHQDEAKDLGAVIQV